MRLSRIDLNLFPVFDAIYSKRNLTRAAEQLNVTQPAVSNALARMRRLFNDPLFVSTARGMVPTPVADNIHRRVNDALLLLNDSIHETGAFDPAQAQKVFRLSMNDMSESLLLPTLVEALQGEAPGIHLESYFTPRREIVQELSAAAIDLAIDAPLVDDPQLLHRPLLSTRYVCLLRPEHPLAQRELTLEDYLSLGHIHISGRRRGAGVIDAELNKLGHQRRIQMRVQHYLVAPKIALRSDLALSGPEILLRHYPGRLLELPFAVPLQTWHLYWHRSTEHDRANVWLREKLVSQVAAFELA